jgi:broad specificity phosphatase PhoE
MSDNQETAPNLDQSGEKAVDFELILARHAEYYDIASENRMFEAVNVADLSNAEKAAKEAEIKSKLGHLTERGVEQAEALGLDIMRQELGSGPVDITFIGSTQEYESPRFTPPNPWAGRRAEETAVLAVTAASQELERLVQNGRIAPDQIRLMSPLPARPFTPNQKPNKRLVERDVYYSPVSKVSLVGVYRQRAEEVIEQEAQFGVPQTPGYETTGEIQPDSINLSNREKELWSRGDPELDDFAARIGNETSADVSSRIAGVMEDINEMARLHHEHFPDRKLVVVLVAHDANIGAVSAQAFGMDRPLIPSFTGRLDIHVSSGTATTEYDGRSYTFNLPNHET